MFHLKIKNKKIQMDTNGKWKMKYKNKTNNRIVTLGCTLQIEIVKTLVSILYLKINK